MFDTAIYKDTNQIARMLIEAGVEIMPGVYRSKRVAKKDGSVYGAAEKEGGLTYYQFYSQNLITLHNVDDYFPRKAWRNIHQINGVNGLLDSDADCPEALALMQRWFPPSVFRFGRESSGFDAHWVYRVGSSFPSVSIVDPATTKADGTHATIIELRCGTTICGIGKHTMTIGSVHPSGEIVALHPEFKQVVLQDTDYAHLVSLAHRIGAAVLLARYMPTNHPASPILSLIAAVLGDAGLTEPDMLLFREGMLSVAPPGCPGVDTIGTTVADNALRTATAGVSPTSDLKALYAIKLGNEKAEMVVKQALEYIRASTRIFAPNTAGPYPPSLTAKDHWSLVLLQPEPDGFAKLPVSVLTGRAANSDDMGGPFGTAFSRLAPNLILGYRHPSTTEMFLALLDCDNCVLPDGTVRPIILRLLKYFDSYAEFSTGSGIHILVWLTEVPSQIYGRNHKDKEWDVEFYWAHQSIPITGNRVILPDWESPGDVQVRTKRFWRLHQDRFPAAYTPRPVQASNGHRSTAPGDPVTAQDVLARLFSEPNAEKWRAVYDGQWQTFFTSPSDADLGLLSKIAYYAGDRTLTEAIFTDSPLAKILIRGTVTEPKRWQTPKWSYEPYRKRTLDKVFAELTRGGPSPRRKPSDSEIVKAKLQEMYAKRSPK